MGGLIPWQIKQAARCAIEWPRRRALRRQLAATAWPGFLYQLGLGGALDQGLVAGGRVKLVPLRERFGDTRTGFQVLYLVSSALPPFWEEIVDWALGHGAAIVWNQNGVAYPAWAGMEYRRWNRPMREGLRKAHHVIYQTEFCRRSADRFLGPANASCSVLMNPVDTFLFQPSPLKQREEVCRLLAIGTHASPSRVRLAIATLGELARRGMNAKLTIAGRYGWKGAERDVPQWIHATGVEGRVTLSGAFTQKEAVLLYQSHDILLHCKAMDPCPTVVAEALACGLPVVAQNNGGLPEMVSPQSGRLVPAEDDYLTEPAPPASAFADAIMEIWPSLDGYSRAARADAEKRFAMEPWLEAHAELFRTVSGKLTS
ncbi:MAG: glycosyltransferase family 4 protein [Verrucomicrobiia bacterium]